MNSPNIFDRGLISKRLQKAAATLQDDFLIRLAAQEIVGRLRGIRRTFELAADLSACHGVVASLLAESSASIKTVALSPILALTAASNPLSVVASEEALPLKEGSIDLAISVLSLHFANDLPGALIQIRRALRPDGLFLGAMLGGDTLIELRQAFMMAEMETAGGASPRVMPTGDIRDMGGLLQRAGFALPVIDSERLTVTYPSPLALIAELKAMGATNPLIARSRKPMQRETLARAIAHYEDHFSDDNGKVRATFEILYLCGWAPHESQQKPLRPGSAEVHLADALRATEKER